MLPYCLRSYLTVPKTWFSLITRCCASYSSFNSCGFPWIGRATIKRTGTACTTASTTDCSRSSDCWTETVAKDESIDFDVWVVNAAGSEGFWCCCCCKFLRGQSISASRDLSSESCPRPTFSSSNWGFREVDNRFAEIVWRSTVATWSGPNPRTLKSWTQTMWSPNRKRPSWNVCLKATRDNIW